jgi:hypothetical protein
VTKEIAISNSAPQHARTVNLSKWLLARGSWFYAGSILIICLVKYGVGVFPSWNYMQALAVNWRSPHSSSLLAFTGTYQLASPASSLLAGWFHLTGNSAFLGFHFVLVCVALSVPFAMPVVRENERLRLLVALLIVGSAIPSLLLSWVGSYDPVSIIAASIAVLARRQWVSTLAWLVFAFNNGFEAIVAGAIVCVIVYFDEPRGINSRVIGPLLGITYGYVGIQLLDRHWGSSISQFSFYEQNGFHRYLVGAIDYWPIIIASALGVGWVFLASNEARHLPAVRCCLVLAILATLVVPIVALDETRVTASIMWAPLLFVATCCVREIEAKDMNKLLRRLIPFALVMILVVAWDGSLVYAGWHGASNFVGYLFLHHSIPTAALP